jgi:hypothetical protein
VIFPLGPSLYVGVFVKTRKNFNDAPEDGCGEELVVPRNAWYDCLIRVLVFTKPLSGLGGINLTKLKNRSDRRNQKDLPRRLPKKK